MCVTMLDELFLAFQINFHHHKYFRDLQISTFKTCMTNKWMANRPHVTREKAISCLKSSNSFQTLFFLFAICGKFQQSVAFLLYLLRFKAIDGHFAISCIIHCDFAIVCDIYCDLWQFCNNIKCFSLFWFFFGSS